MRLADELTAGTLIFRINAFFAFVIIEPLITFRPFHFPPQKNSHDRGHARPVLDVLQNGLPDVTDAITDRALAPSRPALTTDPVMASLFQGLNDGRNVRFRLGLGIGDMPRLQHQAGTVLAYHRLFRCHVHGMAAATQQSGSRIGRPCQDYPQKAFPPLQAGFSFAFS